MSISRLQARELMSRGYEIEATVLNGLVERQTDGTWLVAGQPFEEWLKQVEGQEVLLIAARITGERGTRRVCRTCGAEYEGYECPHCREVHRRLRGR